VRHLKLKRTPYEIIWQVLEYCKEPKKLTQIIQGCNLNTNSATRYLNLLLTKELLLKVNDTYRTLKKGVTYLELIEKIYEALFK
jgi:predicted transcriptional regulator